MQNKELYDNIIENNSIIIEPLNTNNLLAFFNLLILKTNILLETRINFDERLVELAEKQLNIMEKLQNNIYPEIDQYMEYCFSPILLDGYSLIQNKK